MPRAAWLLLLILVPGCATSALDRWSNPGTTYRAYRLPDDPRVAFRWFDRLEQTGWVVVTLDDAWRERATRGDLEDLVTASEASTDAPRGFEFGSETRRTLGLPDQPVSGRLLAAEDGLLLARSDDDADWVEIADVGRRYPGRAFGYWLLILPAITFDIATFPFQIAHYLYKSSG